jgi:hypothetical protein
MADAEPRPSPPPVPSSLTGDPSGPLPISAELTRIDADASSPPPVPATAVVAVADDAAASHIPPPIPSHALSSAPVPPPVPQTEELAATADEPAAKPASDGPRRPSVQVLITTHMSYTSHSSMRSAIAILR